MRLGITGATGFIGWRAVQLAVDRGWKVTIFTRHPGRAAAPPGCDVRRFSLDEPADVEGLDAVLHLAGEPVFGRWTAAKRDRIMTSRVLGTRRLVEGFHRASHPPRVLVGGSAIGYYGDTGDREVDEHSPSGDGFLAEVARAWEAEERGAESDVTRVVFLRTGFVLGRDGGAMKLILPVFRAGLGGRLGDGRQWMSCIHVDDVAGMALWAVENRSIRGPLNAVIPDPCTNREFTRAVARAVRRPAVFPVPALFLRAALGTMSSLMLDSSRVRPSVALQLGYTYTHGDLGGALAGVAA